MPGEVYRRVLSSRKRGLIGWTVSLVALMFLMVIAYPAVRDQDMFADLMEQYPDFVQQIMGLGSGLSITSPAGYLNSQVFANMLPMLFLIFLIGFAVRETAGEERDHTMDLLLAHPVTRERVLVEKLAALLGAGLWLGLASAATLMVFGPLVDMDLGIGGYAGATLSTVLVAWVFGAFALALGAATGSRPVSIGASSGVAVAFYILWGFAPLIDAIEFTNVVNPWYWALAGDPIVNGVQGMNALLLAGITAALALVGVWGFRRRDLGI